LPLTAPKEKSAKRAERGVQKNVQYWSKQSAGRPRQNIEIRVLGSVLRGMYT